MTLLSLEFPSQLKSKGVFTLNDFHNEYIAQIQRKIMYGKITMPGISLEVINVSYDASRFIPVIMGPLTRSLRDKL